MQYVYCCVWLGVLNRKMKIFDLHVVYVYWRRSVCPLVVFMFQGFERAQHIFIHLCHLPRKHTDSKRTTMEKSDPVRSVV